MAKKLSNCGINTIQDLLFHLPYRYQDRTRVTPIQDIRPNDWCVVVGSVCKTEIKFGKRPILSCYIEDKTGLLKLRFFHFNKQQVKALEENTYIRVFGEIKLFSNTLEMIHPEYQLFNDLKECQVEETLTPIYSTTQGLTQTRLRQLIKKALEQATEALEQLEWMSEAQLSQFRLYSIPQALNFLHHPPPDTTLAALEHGNHPAIKRLSFDELLAQRVSMQFAKQKRLALAAPVLAIKDALYQAFIETLPFTLTNAQVRAFQEISQDLAQTTPMLRLVQGDVGAGKTIVAALAALQALASGFQVALMAPTEILSEQHAHHFTAWLTPLGFQVGKLSGKMKTSERRQMLEALATHQLHLIVGTHALFQAGVSFANLGLVIIDEQHRFGVEQRLAIHQKGMQQGISPHQLLMTATPIPRTLAMTYLAHMDISILNELPPGRKPVITAIMGQDKRQTIMARLQDAIAQGRQVYWVCTLIEDSEKQQCMAAVATAEQLKHQLASAKIGLVHGRMKNQDKEAVMMAFKAGDINLLVATTVIEVGVDVANASLMIIENAERLGLSQLHQLRGRVGRGHAQAHCLLLYQPPLSQVSQERLRIMRATQDGFIIAEKDLALRGAGEFLGTRQTGYRPFKIANLPRDEQLLPLVKPLASDLIKNQPVLARQIATCWLGEFESFLQG